MIPQRHPQKSDQISKVLYLKGLFRHGGGDDISVIESMVYVLKILMWGCVRSTKIDSIWRHRIMGIMPLIKGGDHWIINPLSLWGKLRGKRRNVNFFVKVMNENLFIVNTIRMGFLS